MLESSLMLHDALHSSSRIEKHDELTLYHTRPRADNGTKSKFQVYILSSSAFTALLTFIVNAKHIFRNLAYSRRHPGNKYIGLSAQRLRTSESAFVLL